MLTYQQAKDIEDALGHQQAAPIINALQELDQKIERQRTALKQDLLLELATKADIADSRTEIAGLRADIFRLEGKIETEIARLEGKITGLDGKIIGLEGKIETEIARLEGKITGLDGKIETETAKITGELKSIRLWMKLLVAIGILGMTLFSPAAVKLLEMLK